MAEMCNACGICTKKLKKPVDQCDVPTEIAVYEAAY